VRDIMEGARDAAPMPGRRGRGRGGDARSAAPAHAVAESLPPVQLAAEIRRLEAAMMLHAENLEFEEAARVRDAIARLRPLLQDG
jgi:excinuclease ABC subunit B